MPLAMAIKLEEHQPKATTRIREKLAESCLKLNTINHSETNTKIQKIKMQQVTFCADLI